MQPHACVVTGDYDERAAANRESELRVKLRNKCGHGGSLTVISGASGRRPTMKNGAFPDLEKRAGFQVQNSNSILRKNLDYSRGRI